MLKRKYKPYGRCYEDNAGNEYPGVTSILDIMAKDLDWWKMDVSGNYILDQVEAVHRGERIYDRKAILAEGKKAPNNYRDSKGAEGTRIHKIIERHLLHEDIRAELIDDPRMTALIMQIDKWIRDNKLEPVLVEAYLLSKKYNYAGGVDLVAKQNTEKHGEQLVLVDFKTGKTIQDTTKWQLAAYAAAYHEMYEACPDICFLQHISYENQIMLEEGHLHKDEVKKEFKTFLGIYTAFKGRYAKQLGLKK